MILTAEINFKSSLLSSIRQTASVPLSGWYLLNSALVSIKKGIDYRFSLDSITLLEREIPIFDSPLWISIRERLTWGCSFIYLWSFELMLGCFDALKVTFDKFKPPFIKEVYQKHRGKSNSYELGCQIVGCLPPFRIPLNILKQPDYFFILMDYLFRLLVDH